MESIDPHTKKKKKIAENQWFINDFHINVFIAIPALLHVITESYNVIFLTNISNRTAATILQKHHSTLFNTSLRCQHFYFYHALRPPLRLSFFDK